MATSVTQVLLVMALLGGCAAPQGGASYAGGGGGGDPAAEPAPEGDAEAAPEGEPAKTETPCKPDGTEVSHYSECCSNDAYVESIQDPVNGAWHSGRRLCGREP